MTNEEILKRELNGEELDFFKSYPNNFEDAMTAAREEGRREGAIGFHHFTSHFGFQMIIEHKSGIPYFFNGTNKFNVDEVYDLYIQLLQNKSNDTTGI